MYCGVQQQSPGDGHHVLNGLFSDTIMMMGTDSGEANGLFKSSQMIGEFVAGEGSAIVRQVALNNDAIVAAGKLEAVFGSESLVGGQAGLMFDVDPAGGIVDEDTAATVQAFFQTALSTMPPGMLHHSEAFSVMACPTLS
jgi:hypothetical protein